MSCCVMFFKFYCRSIIKKLIKEGEKEEIFFKCREGRKKLQKEPVEREKKESNLQQKNRQSNNVIKRSKDKKQSKFSSQK